MMYTMCIHNLIYYYSQERALADVGGILLVFLLEQSRSMCLSFLLLFDPASVICLQLSCLFNKRKLGNRYGPF